MNCVDFYKFSPGSFNDVNKQIIFIDFLNIIYLHKATCKNSS